MRLCVIGNSHVAMFAGPAAAERGLDLTFFAKPQMQPRDLAVSQGQLVAQTEDMRGWLDRMGTPHRLDMADFDAVLIVAMTTSFFTVTRITQTHLVTGWPSARQAVTAALRGAPKPLSRQPLTRRALLQTLTAVTEASLGLTLARAIRAASDLPIYLAPQPLPSQAVLDQPATYPVLKSLVARGDGAIALSDLRQAQAASFAAVPQMIALQQPPETVVYDCLTHAPFTRGALRLGGSAAQPSDDVMHANDMMGRALLAQIV